MSLLGKLRALLAPRRPAPALPPPAAPPAVDMTDPMTIFFSPPVGGKYKRGRLQRVWMRTVQVGDVLRSPSGSLRVVRKVTRYGNGDLRGVTLAIKRRSWTDRAYTIYSYTDLRVQGWAPAGVNVLLDSEADAWLQADIACSDGRRRVSVDEARSMP